VLQALPGAWATVGSEFRFATETVIRRQARHTANGNDRRESEFAPTV